MTAFVSRGHFSSYEEAIGAMSHIKDEFLPKAEEHKRYEELYQKIYKRIFKQLSPLYKELQGIL
jgi:sugar (pentulose or hexulose) kinase